MFFDQSACLFALPSDVTVGGRHAMKSVCVRVYCIAIVDCGEWLAERGGEGTQWGWSG